MLPADIRAILEQQPRGLAFDIDGTLSPLVPTPDEAQLYPGAADLLAQAKKYAHVCIITGRAVTDGAKMVNVDGLTYIGTHGLEWSDGLPASHPVELLPEALAYVAPGQKLLDIADKQLGSLPGIIVQRKQVGGTIHYRRSADPEQTRARIFATLTEPAQQTHMRLRDGKYAVEVLAPLSIHKGQALQRYVKQHALQSIIFAGDDRTDLDAVLEIAQLRQQGLAAYAIVVQAPDTLPELLAHADRVVQGVGEMVQLLEDIVNTLKTFAGR